MAAGSIYLFADSQLLYWRLGTGFYLASIVGEIEHDRPRAAYIGASNGDAPEFFELFQASMHNVGIDRCRMVKSQPTVEERAFLDEADIILLAGGDVVHGWRTLQNNGVAASVASRHADGAILIGISAGAVHLGLAGWQPSPSNTVQVFTAMGLVPYVVAVHDEVRGWPCIEAAMERHWPGKRAIGIPTGGGYIRRPDGTEAALRYPVFRWPVESGVARHGSVNSSIIAPPECCRAP